MHYAPDPFELWVCESDAKPSMKDLFYSSNPNYAFGLCSICGGREMTIPERMPQYAIDALTEDKQPIRQDLWAQQEANRYAAAMAFADERDNA